MLSRTDFKVLMIGIILGTFIFGLVPAYAGPVLQQLYVDYSAVKKIIIDGVEKKPADDMKPFIANGRTYVALTYIADAFGKEVNFDSNTGTITIGKTNELYNGPMNMEASDDFLGTLEKWYVDHSKNSTLKNWRIDGPNGLACDGGGYLNFKEIYRNGKPYTQEVDVAVEEDNVHAGLHVGVDKDHHFSDYVQIGNYDGLYGSYNGDEGGYIKIGKNVDSNVSSIIKYKSKFELNKFYHIKAVYNNDGNVDIYIDNKFVSTFRSQGIDSSLGLCVTNIYNNNEGKAHFKNYEVTYNGEYQPTIYKPGF